MLFKKDTTLGLDISLNNRKKLHFTARRLGKFERNGNCLDI